MKSSSAKPDRRMVRTKKSLADALKQLILEKDYDGITIQEIIDRANVGRSTFYTHYESKEQLLIGNINFEEHLIHTSPPDHPMGINIPYLFEHTREHLPLFKAMRHSRGAEVVREYFADLCSGKIAEHLKRRSSFNKKEQPMLNYKAEAAAGAIVRMLFKWLDDGARVPPVKMIAYAEKILDTLVQDAPFLYERSTGAGNPPAAAADAECVTGGF